MDHDFPTWETMLQIDFLMLAVALAATVFFVVQRRTLVHAQAWAGSFVILTGLWVFASLYLTDLVIMAFMPSDMSMADTIATIHWLHDAYNWHVSAAAAVLIFAGMAVTIRQLTDQTRAALNDREAALRSEQRLRTVVESEPECVKTIDRDGILLDMNPAGIEMIEAHSQDEVRGLSVFDLIVPQYHLAFRHCIDQVFSGRQTRMQFEIVGRNGTRRWMEQVAAPLMAQDGSDEIAEMLAVTRDITDHVAAMEELSVQKQKAEAANDAKTRFLANMSHEIRTPLNGVLGMAQVLSRQNLGAPADDYIATILESGDALMAVVNDVLDVAKIEAQRLELVPQEVTVRASLARTMDLWLPLAEKKGLDLTLNVADDVPTQLVFDEVRVRQCLSNLVSNAIKFTDRGRVEIAVTAEPKVALRNDVPDTSLVTITVSDTGIGVAEEDQTRLFDAFEQADTSATRAHGGTGLGLAIARKLARLMGGDLTVASKLGHGASFTLTFRADLADAFDQQDMGVPFAVHG